MEKQKNSNRKDLADKLEVIGEIFEIDGMAELLGKFDEKMNLVKFNAVTIQITSLLLKANKPLADRVAALADGMDLEKVQELDDAAYSIALKKAILGDVMGFFAPSAPSDGQA